MSIEEELHNVSVQLHDLSELLRQQRQVIILTHRIIKKIQELIAKEGSENGRKNNS